MAGVLTIHYGLPGTGKSLFAMNDVIIPAVKSGRPFFTNITGISLSGLFAVTDVHQSLIKYYPVKDISDVIRYFDDSSICANGVFVLDEMKDFVDNERAVSWLESRINVMRKQCVDFLLIAQLPEKEYIHPHIIELADSCNVAVSRKKYNDTSHVDWYYVDGGLPRIVNKIPKNSTGKKVRRKPVEVYSTYKTSENAFYTGAEDSTYRGLKWWQTRTAKLRFVLIGLFAFILVMFGYLAYSFKSFMSPKKPNETEEIKNVDTGKPDYRIEDDVLERDAIRATRGNQGIPNAVNSNSGLFAPQQCYKWRICTGTLCKTDVGLFTLDPGAYDNARLCSGNSCVLPCEDDNGLSSGRRLLRPGEPLSP